MVSIGLGMSLALLGAAETSLAGQDRDTRALRYASRAAASLAVSELRRLPSVRDAGRAGPMAEVSATPGTFVDATLNAQFSSIATYQQEREAEGKPWG